MVVSVAESLCLGFMLCVGTQEIVVGWGFDFDTCRLMVIVCYRLLGLWKLFSILF